MPDISKAFSGIWVPREVVLDESLDPMAKLLYAMVMALDNDGCTASNAYLAGLLGCSDRHVRGLLEALESKGLLRRSETPEGRVITTASTAALKPQGGGTTVPGGAELQFRGGRNHSSANIKGNRKEDSILTLTLPFESDRFRKAWGEWVDHRRQIKAKLTNLAANKQLSMLKTLGEDRAIACIEKSISSGWRGLFPESLGRNTFLPRQPLTAEQHKDFFNPQNHG